MNNYKRELAIAKAGLAVSLLIFMLFIVFVFGKVNTFRHKQIKNGVEEIGEAVHIEPAH